MCRLTTQLNVLCIYFPMCYNIIECVEIVRKERLVCARYLVCLSLRLDHDWGWCASGKGWVLPTREAGETVPVLHTHGNDLEDSRIIPDPPQHLVPAHVDLVHCDEFRQSLGGPRVLLDILHTRQPGTT